MRTERQLTSTSKTIDDGIAALRRGFEDAERRMGRSFWLELERAGEKPLCGEARGFIHSALALYGPWGRSDELVERNKRRIKLARMAESLAVEIEADPEEDMTYFLRVGESTLAENGTVELPIRLRAFAESLDDILPARPGRPTRREDDVLIEMVAEVYHRVGGRVAVSRGGPFVRFLEVVWKVLPPAQRCASAETLARRAKAMLPRLRQRIAELPERVAGKPMFDEVG